MASLAPITHKSVVAMAVPIMLANVSQPMLGIVDTAVIGQLPEPFYIGAVAIGAMIFNLVYWAFGFLRMGTSGLAAQAWGADDGKELTAIFYRALLLAGLLGIMLLAVAPLISHIAFWAIEASADVEREAQTYFAIRIWSAPFALANYAVLGWLIGIGAMRSALLVQLWLYVVNMVLDAVFVLHFNMATEGIGYGTLIAEVSAALIGIAVVRHYLKAAGERPSRARVLDREKVRRMLAVNSDIMVRSLLLTFGFSWFAAQGAKLGEVTLAANAILLHFFSIGSYMIDGFANVTEALVGHAVGARQRDRFARAVRVSSGWALATGAVLSLATLALGPWAIDLMTVNGEVRAAARTYLWWAALTPVLGAACFQLDGIFIGATRTRDMRNMMIISLAVFLAAGYALSEAVGNHGLWLAMCLFFILRGATLYVRLAALEREVFA
ncbi:MAG: MATE family efflux transporter [Anderseniella sp.]|jgi:MATE family multidrug resistance protein|nr:MATE family efflux transporter [Anderseniella sp.]